MTKACLRFLILALLGLSCAKADTGRWAGFDERLNAVVLRLPDQPIIAGSFKEFLEKLEEISSPLESEMSTALADCIHWLGDLGQATWAPLQNLSETDNGQQRTVTDLGVGGSSKFYWAKIDIP